MSYILKFFTSTVTVYRLVKGAMEQYFHDSCKQVLCTNIKLVLLCHCKFRNGEIKSQGSVPRRCGTSTCTVVTSMCGSWICNRPSKFSIYLRTVIWTDNPSSYETEIAICYHWNFFHSCPKFVLVFFKYCKYRSMNQIIRLAKFTLNSEIRTTQGLCWLMDQQIHPPSKFKFKLLINCKD